MMSNFRTLKKTDKDFQKYLMGTFSSHQVALPVQSLNVGTQDEIITFEIKNQSDIKRPNYLFYWVQLIKLRSYILILVPLFFVIIKNYVDDRFFDPFSLTLAAISTLILFAGMNIRTDVNDHVSGYDRVVPSEIPRPLSLGWTTAHEASFLSVVLLVFGTLLSVPVLILQKEALRVAGVILVLYLLGQFFRKNSFKNQRFGEFVLFILFGPGICAGYQTALGSGIDTEILVFGCLWGLAVLFLLHLNNFSHLLSASQAKIHNTMTRIGFDRAKNFLVLWLVILNTSWVLYHYFYTSVFWSWFASITFLFWSIATAIKIAEISSPVGSDLLAARKRGYRNFRLMVLLLYLEYIWYLAQKIGWNQLL